MIILILLIVILIIIFCRETFKNASFPIDIIYTWAGENNTNNNRNSNNNELKYSLRSVFKNMPWINHIYIVVTHPQPKPSWFNENYSKYITIVDDNSIFPNINDTPSTNSNAIEYTIHRIPGLSEHYIYLNDDFFIGKPLDYTYFFTPKGNPIVADVIKYPSKMGNSSMKLPLTVNGFYPHIPMSHLKSQCQLFEKEYQDYVNWVRSHKTRTGLGCDDCKGMLCPCQQAHAPLHIFLHQKGKVKLKRAAVGNSCSNTYVNSYCMDTLNNILLDSPSTFCIQDTETDNSKRILIREKMNVFFKKMYPEIPPFEN